MAENSTKTRKELLRMCAARNILGCSNKKKSELLKMLAAPVSTPSHDPGSISTEQRARLAGTFSNYVRGYHLINPEPIKEAVWESINAAVLRESGCPVSYQSNGSHNPGTDIASALGTMANKTSKYNPGNKSFSISSYRLTALCSASAHGTISDIIAGIREKNNFHYYSLLVREDCADTIRYDWYLLPSTLPILDPTSYSWEKRTGKNGCVAGWATDSILGANMKIEFSMSSQLWINNIPSSAVQSHLVATCDADKCPKLNYGQLYAKIGKFTN